MVRGLQHGQTAAAHMRSALDGLVGEHHPLRRVRCDRHVSDRAGVEVLRQPFPKRLHFHLVGPRVPLSVAPTSASILPGHCSEATHLPAHNAYFLSHSCWQVLLFVLYLLLLDAEFTTGGQAIFISVLLMLANLVSRLPTGQQPS